MEISFPCAYHLTRMEIFDKEAKEIKNISVDPHHLMLEEVNKISSKFKFQMLLPPKKRIVLQKESTTLKERKMFTATSGFVSLERKKMF
jgi:hypothetical protein